MKLKAAIATVLDAAFDLRMDTITIEFSDGTTATGRICPKDAEKMTRTIAHRLINLEEFNRENATSRKNQQIRRALTKKFGLEAE